MKSPSISKYTWTFICGRIEGVSRWIAYLISKRSRGYSSQFGQDAFIHETFFCEKKNGCFVDIGANDGITGSNTYYFEKVLGWRGICIEPMPQTFEALKKVRTSHLVQGCISDVPGTEEFLQISGRWAVLSGIIRKYDTRHASRVKNVLDSGQGSSTVIKVQCYRLADLLAKYQIAEVDLLSLDTEGGELAILKGLDFDSIKIDVITVENNFHDREMREFLQGKGYRLVAIIGVDEVYRRIPVTAEARH